MQKSYKTYNVKEKLSVTLMKCGFATFQGGKTPFEEVGADHVRVQRVINCNHHVKTMFMDVITQPNIEQNFNG
jgi:hypothetical protein